MRVKTLAAGAVLLIGGLVLASAEGLPDLGRLPGLGGGDDDCADRRVLASATWEPRRAPGDLRVTVRVNGTLDDQRKLRTSPYRRVVKVCVRPGERVGVWLSVTAANGATRDAPPDVLACELTGDVVRPDRSVRERRSVCSVTVSVRPA